MTDGFLMLVDVLTARRETVRMQVERESFICADVQDESWFPVRTIIRSWSVEQHHDATQIVAKMRDE